MNESVFVLALLGGFFLVHFTYRFSLPTLNHDGQRILFLSGIAGGLLFAAARLIIYSCPAFTQDAYRYLNGFLNRPPPPYTGTSILAFALGLFFPLCINLVLALKALPRSPVELRIGDTLVRLVRRDVSLVKYLKTLAFTEATIWRLNQPNADALLSWLHEAMYKAVRVALSFENRKYYIGLIVLGPALRRDSYIRLLVFRSGYRDEKSLMFYQTNNYEPQIIQLESVGVTNQEAERRLPYVLLPVGNIKTATLYDKEAYDRFAMLHAERRDQKTVIA